MASDKHSAFSSTFPIYLFTRRTEEVPVEEDEISKESEATLNPEEEDKKITVDGDEVLIEDVQQEPQEPAVPKTKKITIDEWVHTNSQPPIWTRQVL